MNSAAKIMYAVLGLLLVAGCEQNRDRDNDRTAPMPRESTEPSTTPAGGVADQPTVPPSPGTSTDVPSPGTTTPPVAPPQPSGTGTTTQPGTGTTTQPGTGTATQPGTGTTTQPGTGTTTQPGTGTTTQPGTGTSTRAPEDTSMQTGDAGPIERGRGPETLP